MKTIDFTQAIFSGSAPTLETCPTLLSPRGTPLVEIALIGRSNVGKSSLINHLCQKRHLAKTSNTPGKTRMLNFYTVDQRIALVDLPGYGYAKVCREVQKQWEAELDRYLNQRSTLRLGLFLFDIRRTPTSTDQEVFAWAHHHHLPLILVITKADKLSTSRRQGTLRQLKEEFEKNISFLETPIVVHSSQKRMGRDVLMRRITEFLP